MGLYVTYYRDTTPDKNISNGQSELLRVSGDYSRPSAALNVPKPRAQEFCGLYRI